MRHQDKLALIEKDVDREPALARQFQVFGTPTFVLLDAQGKNLGRVPPDLDAARWEQRLVGLAGV